MIRRAALLVLLGLTLGSASALAVDPEYQSAMRAVNRYMAQSQFEAAADLLEQVLAKQPRDLSASITYVEALLALGRPDDADRFLVGALERVTDKADLYRMRSRVRRVQGRLDEAFADLLLVVETQPERAPWAYRETQDLLKEGLDPEAARKAAEKAAKSPEGASRTALLVAVLAAHQGRGDEALRLVAEYDQSAQQHGEALRRFADEMISLDKRDLARGALAAAVERAATPERRTDHLFRTADLAEKDGHYAEALAALDRIAAERSGKSAAANARLRSAQLKDTRMGDFAGALAIYREIQDDPSLGHHRPAMQIAMADCYVRLGRFDEAAATYAEAGPEAFDPEHAEMAALRLADIEFYRGNPDSSLALYQKMAEAYPRSLYTDQAAGRYILINKYLQFRMAGELVKTWGRMEWARTAGDTALAAATASSLLERDPEGELAGEALFLLAENAEKAGNPRAAAARLEEIARRFPGDRSRAPEALLRLGALLAGPLKEPDQALARYETILTDYPASVQAVDARRRMEALRRELRS